MCYNRIIPNSFVVVLVHLVGIFGGFALSSFPQPEQTNKNYFFLEKSQLTKIAKSSAGEGVVIPMKSTGLKMIFWLFYDYEWDGVTPKPRSPSLRPGRVTYSKMYILYISSCSELKASIFDQKFHHQNEKATFIECLSFFCFTMMLSWKRCMGEGGNSNIF